MFDLSSLTTLRLPLHAESVLRLSSIDNVRVSVPELGDQPRLILGGGSNLVVAEPHFDGVVIRPEIRGISASMDGDRVVVEVGAGESWHGLVQHTLAQGWYGLENLALIPGWVGAAPVQNIGAYGVEFSDHCQSVTLYDMVDHEVCELDCASMRFGYRHSLLKEQPDRFLVLRVTLALSTTANTRVGYGVLEEEIARLGGSTESPLDVASAVISIRQSKLPDPDTHPNVGSFFKNPIVRQEVAERLLAHYPDMPHYPDAVGCKLAAGWMIDRLGLRGARVGGFSVHEKQALVLINDREGTVSDLRQLVAQIRDAVKQTFGVSLQIEPTQLGRL